MNFSSVPHPRGFNQLKVLYEMKQDYAQAYLRLREKYGDVVRLQIPFKAFLTFKPEHLKFILKEGAAFFRKSDLYETLKVVLGNGLVTAEGELWKKQRKTIAPEFHTKSIQNFSSLIVSNTHELIEEWKRVSRDGVLQSRDIAGDMMRLTFGIVGDALFGSDIRNESKRVKECLYAVFEDSTRRSTNLIKVKLPFKTKSQVKAEKAASTLRQLVMEIIRKRVQEQEKGVVRTDVLSRLIASSNGEGDQQLIDEINTLIIAGHETTSQTLSWTWYLLARNPEVDEKLDQELAEVLGNRTPTFEDVKDLKYTKAVIQESMRLYPPVPVVSRNPIREVEIGGIMIQPDTIVSICPIVMHHHPSYWKNPEQFIPERFDEKRASQIEEYTYLPFLAGPRACIGEHFAMTEAVMSLAMMRSQFKLSLAQVEPILPEAKTTLRPKGGLVMHLKQVKRRTLQKPRAPFQERHPRELNPNP